MKKFLFALIALCSATFAEVHTHDGLFLNMNLGIGYSAISEEFIFEEDGTSSANFDFKIGPTVTNNLALHLTISSVSLGKIEGECGIEYNNFGYVLFGGGATFYLPMANAYLTASAGRSEFYLFDNDIDYDFFDDGFGFQVGIGKEWWVSANWGLGMSFTYGMATDDDCTVHSFHIGFSATFN